MAPVREIVLDTETTGIDPKQGHRIVEIGAIELIDKRLTGKAFHAYLNPDRDVSYSAYRVHGITRHFLKDKPRFGEIADPFLKFVSDSKMVIHNAPFDVRFLNHELSLLAKPDTKHLSLENTVDTLAMARTLFPGAPNNLDALCQRFDIDISGRVQHGAFKDALLLAKVYAKMTTAGGEQQRSTIQRRPAGGNLSRSATTNRKSIAVES
jgi:DNA polymerase-3 subunit epsilon